MNKGRFISKRFKGNLTADGLKIQVWSTTSANLTWAGERCEVVSFSDNGMITLIVKNKMYYVHSSAVIFQISDDSNYDKKDSTIINQTVKRKKKRSPSKKKRVVN